MRAPAGWKVEPGGKPAVVAGARDTRKEARVSRKEYSGFFPLKDPRVPLIGYTGAPGKCSSLLYRGE